MKNLIYKLFPKTVSLSIRLHSIFITKYLKECKSAKAEFGNSLEIITT